VNQVNLIPARRREARALRKRLRLWGAVLGVYGSVALAGYFACWAFAGESPSPRQRALRHLRGDIQATGRELRRTRMQIGQELLKLQAQRAVGRHPDWSILLAAISSTVGNEIVLERCALSPVEKKDSEDDASSSSSRAKGRATEAEPRFRLDVDGIAKSPPTVSQYILRLEQMRLFDRVRLVKTNRRQFLDTEAVGFHVECVLGARGGPGQ